MATKKSTAKSKAKKAPAKKRYKSAVSGKIISAKQAAANPRETYGSPVKKKK